MENQNEIILKLALNAWQSQLNRASKLFDDLTDEQLQGEVSTNRNTGVYLLGHLVATHDTMLPLFGFGDQLHPELVEIFIKNPDNSDLEKPPIEQLRSYWKEVNGALNPRLSALSLAEWLEKHSSVSEEDFKNEPHRNKLNVLLGRTNHLSYHLGQLAFLKVNTLVSNNQ